MQNIHQTRDFYLAAYLVAKGIKLQSHNKINSNTLFNFDNDSQTQAAVESYYSMSATIEPITYGNAIKALKSIVHSYDTTNTNSKGNNYVKQYRGRQ